MKFQNEILILLVAIVLCAGAIFLLYPVVNETNGEIVSSGIVRKYLLYVPDNYQEGEPTALVISLHGFASWSDHQRGISQFNALADKHGFIVVYPSGKGFPPRWQTGDYGGEDPLLDVKFVDDLINKLIDEYSIDFRLIYVNGFSGGGGMTYVLACKLADKIAAVGTVAGSYDLPAEDCNPVRKIPVIAFHGTDDWFVPYEGGYVAPPGFILPAMDDWIQLWSERNGCNESPLEFLKVGDVEGIRYVECQGGSEIHYYKILGGGHSWPGGEQLPQLIVGHTTDEIDATVLMWDFFNAYVLDEK